MMDLMGAIDPASLGLDAGMVMAVNEMTNWVKGKLGEWTWDDKFSRFYPVIPFLCAFAVCLMVHQALWPALKCCVMYGLWSTFAWNLYKKSWKGE